MRSFQSPSTITLGAVHLTRISPCRLPAYVAELPYPTHCGRTIFAPLMPRASVAATPSKGPAVEEHLYPSPGLSLPPQRTDSSHSWLDIDGGNLPVLGHEATNSSDVPASGGNIFSPEVVRTRIPRAWAVDDDEDYGEPGSTSQVSQRLDWHWALSSGPF